MGHTPTLLLPSFGEPDEGPWRGTVEGIRKDRCSSYPHTPVVRVDLHPTRNGQKESAKSKLSALIALGVGGNRALEGHTRPDWWVFPRRRSSTGFSDLLGRK